MPIDHLYPIYNRQYRDQEPVLSKDKNASNQVSQETNQFMKAQMTLNMENNFHGMTIAFKNDEKDTLIEAPLDKDKNFMILNF